MKKVTAGIGVLAATGAALLGTIALTGPAAAKSRCPVPRSALVPHLAYPCNGTTIKRGSMPTFKVIDRNSKAGKFPPYLNLQDKRSMEHGHLKPNADGNGVYHTLNRAGHGRFTYQVPKKYTFDGYWRVTPGTYYLQIEQIDDRAGIEGTFYSPIITIHVR